MLIASMVVRYQKYWSLYSRLSSDGWILVMLILMVFPHLPAWIPPFDGDVPVPWFMVKPPCLPDNLHETSLFYELPQVFAVWHLDHMKSAFKVCPFWVFGNPYPSPIPVSLPCKVLLNLSKTIWLLAIHWISIYPRHWLPRSKSLDHDSCRLRHHCGYT